MSILFRIVLAFVLMSPALALAQAQKKPVASPALEAEFNAFIAKFRAALKANDPAAVAGMTKLPFMGDKAYADVAQFRAKAYPEFFSAKDRACIQRKRNTVEMARTTTTTLSSAARASSPSPGSQPDSFLRRLA